MEILDPSEHVLQRELKQAGPYFSFFFLLVIDGLG